MGCFGRRETEFYCHVILLDESEFPVTIQKSTLGQEVLENVFDHLNLLERDYFGLRYVDKASHSRWLDPIKLVTKQLKAGPPYLLYFCVKFYAADPCNLQEELTRYFFFLQLKRDIFQGRLPCSQNFLSEVSAYALQSELGDFDPKQHTPGYVSEFRFVPKQTEELETRIMDCHKRLTGIVPSVAEFMYLDKVKWLEMYGVDLHLVKGEDDVEYFVALKPAGVVVYNNKTPVGTYLWPKITKIDFKGKRFSLNVSAKEGKEYVYIFYLPNKSQCKHLWKCCVEHHSFFRLDKVKPPTGSSFSGLLRTGSGFRYSGRTQKEALEQGHRIKRPSPLVQRKPSKRYNRRESQCSERGNSCVSPIQKKNGFEETHCNSLPTATPAMSLKTTSENQGVADARGPGMPWEELAQTQAGLYTPAPESPRSVRSSGSTGKVGRRAPKFPSPHRRSGQSSGSETDSPRKRSRSRSAYYSDDDISRRRRHHKRSHRHRHSHSADSGSDTGSLPGRKSHSRRKYRGPTNIEEVAKLGDAAPYHWDEYGRDRRQRHHRDMNYHSDVRSDGSSIPRPHSRVYSDYEGVSQTDKMVPALDVIHPRIALTREAKELRHRHHRHQRHSHHGNPQSESGHSTFSAPPAPPTKILADLGPEGLLSQHMQKSSGHPVFRMVNPGSSGNFPLYGSIPRYSSQHGINGSTVGPSDVHFGNSAAQYPFVEVNGNVSHFRNHGSRTDYIEVVSGPPPQQQINRYHEGISYHKPLHPSGKSTFL